MIKHHPNIEILEAHMRGELSISLSLMIAAHAQLCKTCLSKMEQINEKLAQEAFNLCCNSISHDGNFNELNHDEMINQITQSQDIEEDTNPPKCSEIQINQQAIKIPKVLRQFVTNDWLKLGKINKMKLNLEQDSNKASILQIASGGKIPQHKHKGVELTLLLEGEFIDNNQVFTKGDFITLGAHDEHAPYTKTGCLCFVIVDAPLQFTKGFSRLLNPLGRLII